MNQSIGMLGRVGGAIGLAMLAIGCHPPAASPGPSCPAPVSTQAEMQYVLSGGVLNPGPRELKPGDTVAAIIAENLSGSPGKPITIVLIRQAPEGKTRVLIELDAQGHLMDEKQDWALRNGDELVFPGGAGSDSTRNPTGPPPRTAE